jgi:SAM-dependent methyltransferase
MSFGDSIWENIYKTASWGAYPSEEAIRFYMRAKGSFESPAVLDIGSGQGSLSWFMSREGARVTAFDGSPTALSLLDELTSSFGQQVNASVRGDILRPLEYFSEPFEILVDHYALYSNPEDKITLAYQQYLELLKPGGRLLTCGFGENFDGFGTGKQLSENTWTDIPEGPLQDRGMTTFWTEERLCETLEEVGFEIDYTEVIQHKIADTFQEKIIIAAKRNL